MRADIPIEDGIDVTVRAREAREGIARLAEQAGQSRPGPSLSGPPGQIAVPARVDAGSHSAAPDEPAVVHLAAMVTEAGWTFVQRASGRLAIDLDVPGLFCQAIVEPTSLGGCRARVDLARLGDAAADVRAALAVLLLTVVGAVRFVRAGAESAAGTMPVFIEVDIESAATSAELHRGLSALSVACRIAAREAKALLDPDVARSYPGGPRVGRLIHTPDAQQRRHTWDTP